MTAAIPASHWQTVIKPCARCGRRITGKKIVKGTTRYCDECAKAKHREDKAAYKARVKAGLVERTPPDTRLTLVRAPGDVWPARCELSFISWKRVLKDDDELAGATWHDRRGNEWRVTDGKLQQAAG